MMKFFCDNCQGLLVGPAPKEVTAQTLPGCMSHPGAAFRMTASESTQAAPITVKVILPGEFCEACKTAIVSNLQPDWVANKGMTKKLGV